MPVSFRSFLIAVIALIAPTVASAEFVSQLNGVNQTSNFQFLDGNNQLQTSGTTARSQFDTTPVVPAPFLRAMSTGFDDFTLASNGQVDQIEWTGAYRGIAPTDLRASQFQISFYQDNGGAVGTQIGSTILAPIGTVAETTNGGNHFRYTYTPASSLVFAGGTKYWMSVVAALNYGDDGVPSPTSNEWGWAFNNTGNLNSYQDDQVGPESGGFLTYVTYNDPTDYSFRITTTVVPEPSSCLLLAGAIGGVAVRRWRKGRKQAV